METLQVFKGLEGLTGFITESILSIERDQKIKVVTDLALHHLNIPYIYGAQSPFDGFDCSGFIVYLLRSTGVIRDTEDYAAHSLYDKFPKIHRAEPGAVVYYGPGAVTHCMLCLNDVLCIGATGGDKNTKTRADAVRVNAMVRVRAINYRGDIIGYNRPFQKLYMG